MGEIEAQSKIEQDVGGYRERYQQRYRHRQHGREEEAATNCGQEAPDVQLLQADEEKEDEDADAEHHLHFRACSDQPAHGAKKYSGRGVGDDRTEAEPLEDAFKQLGEDDQKTN